MKKPLLNFKEYAKDNRGESIYQVFNHQGEYLGIVCKSRVGRFIHPIFQPDEATFFTNGCLREIIEFMSSLYNKKNKSGKT